MIALLAAIAFVNAAHGGGGSVTSFTITVTAQAAGNDNVVCVATESATDRTISTITDNATGSSNAYAATSPATLRTRTGVGAVECWTGHIVRTGATTITVTLSGVASFVDGYSRQYSGVLAIRGGFTNSGTGTTLTITVTSDNANNFVVGALADTQGRNSAITITVGVNGDANTNVPSATANNTAAGAGAALTVTGTMTPNSDTWDAAAVELCTVNPCVAAGAGPAESGMRGFWGRLDKKSTSPYTSGQGGFLWNPSTTCSAPQLPRQKFASLVRRARRTRRRWTTSSASASTSR